MQYLQKRGRAARCQLRAMPCAGAQSAASANAEQASVESRHSLGCATVHARKGCARNPRFRESWVISRRRQMPASSDTRGIMATMSASWNTPALNSRQLSVLRRTNKISNKFVAHYSHDGQNQQRRACVRLLPGEILVCRGRLDRSGDCRLLPFALSAMVAGRLAGV